MEEVLRISDVVKATRLSRSSIYLLLKDNDFPPPKRLGKKVVFWTETEIQRWLENRPAAGGWGDMGVRKKADGSQVIGVDAWLEQSTGDRS